MKKNNYRSITILPLLAFLCTALFSFSGKWGGDVFEVYHNGKQVHKQFMYDDKNVKILQLTATGNNDKIDIYYSHCGATGISRTITIKDEKNKTLKEFKFKDEKSRSAMSINLNNVPGIQKNKSTRLNLYYSSKEIPGGSLLAAIVVKHGAVATNP